MKESQLHIKTLKEAPKDELSVNASLLIRAGFVEKLTAGVYNLLPLGLKVINNIENIVREEMLKLGAQEVLLSSLHPKKNWQITGRWQSFDALFKVKSRFGSEYALGPTHEEIITPLAKQLISSYRDLPLALFQIQTKFRDEPRPRSGLLRGREFIMKDLYSFHTDEHSLDKYYEKVKRSYQRIFKKCGLTAVIVEASGGTFSRLSHEFQVFSPEGEDTIYYCPHCGFARNKEIIGKTKKCPRCSYPLEKKKGIEVGNIFKLKDKYSNPFHLQYLDKTGKAHNVLMGCYGIGITRLMGTIVETSHDQKGIIWPKTVAPYLIHLIPIFGQEAKINQRIKKEVEKIVATLEKKHLKVLEDDRPNISNGQKLVEADLIGLPYRVVVSAQTIRKNKVEIKNRKTGITRLQSLTALTKSL